MYGVVVLIAVTEMNKSSKCFQTVCKVT